MRNRERILNAHLLYLHADTLKFQHRAIFKHIVWYLNASRISVHLLGHESNRQRERQEKKTVLNKCEQRQNSDAMKSVVEVALNSIFDSGRRLKED